MGIGRDDGVATVSAYEPPRARSPKRQPPSPRAAKPESRHAATEPNGDAGQSSFERVYRGILRSLYEGRFVPGQRLVEPDLMRQFHVGRGTIREVFNRLSSVGIVTLVRHRGAAVRMLSRSEVNQLLDVVGTLFGLAARRAVEQIAREPAKAEMLRAAHEQIRPYEWKDDFAGFVEARENFYRAVIQISGNREITRLFPTMKVHIMRLQVRHFQHAADALQIADYDAVTEAILSGDPDRAEATARAHVQHTTARIAGVPDRAFEPEDE